MKSTVPTNILNWHGGAHLTKSMRGEVVAHLQRLLNTRIGTSLSAPAYGIADLSDVIAHLPEGGQLVAQSIHDAISTFEPRLRRVHVVQQPTDNPAVICFAITGHLDNQTPFTSTTLVSANGHIEVCT